MSLGFQCLISRKGTELGHVLVLSTNRKSHIGSLPVPSHLTLSDLERLKSRSLRFRSRMSDKGADLGHMLLLLNINNETYYMDTYGLSRSLGSNVIEPVDSQSYGIRS